MMNKGRLMRDYGFTLLELLVSIVMLGIIILIIAGAMRLGFRSVDTGEKKIESLERTRASLTIIDSQIQSEIPLTYDEEGVRKYYFKGSKDSLTFTTNYSLWGGQKGYVIVTYRVVTDENGKQALYASENILGMENKAETKLFDGFDAISFDYFYKDIFLEEEEEEAGGRWIEQWTDEENIPQKVRLHLATAGRDFSIIIPMRTRATLIQTSPAPRLTGQ